MMNSNGMIYSEQKRKAFDLGRRIAETGFSLQDNPFVNVHPRFSSRWGSGYLAASTLEALSSAWCGRTRHGSNLIETLARSNLPEF